MTIGSVQYVNALPLFTAFDAYPLTFGTPTALNQQLRAGEISCALSSSVAFLENEEHLQLIAPFGIAARGPSQSVTLYTKGDLDKIAVTKESASSVALLRILCEKFWKIDPVFELYEPGQTYDNFLLIGDQALTHSAHGFYELDLSEEWARFTKTSFPFALLMGRKDLPQETIENIQAALHASYSWSQAHPEEILKIASERVPVPKNYFSGLTYLFEEQEWAGLNLFKEYLCTLKRPLKASSTCLTR